MYNTTKTASAIKAMAKERDISIAALLNSCGLGKDAVNTMARRGSWLQADSLAKIADELECSVDYLLGRTNDPNAHKQTAHTLFSNNSDVRGIIGNNSSISIGGSDLCEGSDEHLQELVKLYSSLSTRKKAELLILVDDFVKGVEK